MRDYRESVVLTSLGLGQRTGPGYDLGPSWSCLSHGGREEDRRLHGHLILRGDLLRVLAFIPGSGVHPGDSEYPGAVIKRGQIEQNEQVVVVCPRIASRP